MATSKREQLLDTALQLFYREGYHATGIERILAESGVAKMTLYKHFASKDELMLAALQRRHEQLAALLQGVFAQPPAQALVACFEGLQQWIVARDFCGCPFSHAAAEFHQAGHPLHQLARQHKAFLGELFSGALVQLGVAQPALLAQQLLLLFEGALSLAHVQGPAEQGHQAAAAARVLLAAAGVQLPPSR